MSWSANTQALPADVEARVDALEPYGEGTQEREDQLAAGKAAAKALVASGAVGKGEAFSIVLSGHANPGHAPATGWVNDCVTVSVTQIGASQVAQFDAAQASLLASEQ